MISGRVQERACREGSGFEARQSLLRRDSVRLIATIPRRQVAGDWQSSWGYSVTTCSVPREAPGAGELEVVAPDGYLIHSRGSDSNMRTEMPSVNSREDSLWQQRPRPAS